jgi:hypothetical protein
LSQKLKRVIVEKWIKKRNAICAAFNEKSRWHYKRMFSLHFRPNNQNVLRKYKNEIFFLHIVVLMEENQKN